LPKCRYEIIRKSALDSSTKWRIGMYCSRSAAALSATLQLPIRSHTSFGGDPKRRLRWWKSASFETMVRPCSPRSAKPPCRMLDPCRYRVRGCIPGTRLRASGPASARGCGRVAVSKTRHHHQSVLEVRSKSQCGTNIR